MPAQDIFHLCCSLPGPTYFPPASVLSLGSGPRQNRGLSSKKLISPFLREKTLSVRSSLLLQLSLVDCYLCYLLNKHIRDSLSEKHHRNTCQHTFRLVFFLKGNRRYGTAVWCANRAGGMLPHNLCQPQRKQEMKLGPFLLKGKMPRQLRCATCHSSGR